MFPASFEYRAASSVEEAISLLQEHGDEAKLLAGGHSLLPMMKLRLATPGVLIDLGRLPALAGVSVNGALTIGAMTTYSAAADAAAVQRHAPLLSEVLGQVGDVQVRNRGTVGGSIAHADPAADLPAALLTLEATMTAEGPNGRRQIPASAFFQGLFATALEPEEVLTAVSLPFAAARSGSAYEKFRNPASGYAIVGVAAVIALDSDGRPSARVAITGAGSQAVRLTAVEEALNGGAFDAAALASAADHAADGLELLGDLHASATYRAHLARVYTRRALTRALERAHAAA